MNNMTYPWPSPLDPSATSQTTRYRYGTVTLTTYLAHDGTVERWEIVGEHEIRRVNGKRSVYRATLPRCRCWEGDSPNCGRFQVETEHMESR